MTRKVIDDQNDYFTSQNKWLSTETRDALQMIEEEQDNLINKIEKSNLLALDFDKNDDLILSKESNLKNTLNKSLKSSIIFN